MKKTWILSGVFIIGILLLSMLTSAVVNHRYSWLSKNNELTGKAYDVPALPSKGPISVWSLTQNADDSISGNNGQVNYINFFTGGKGALFDGISSFITVPQESVSLEPQNITITAVINPVNPSDARYQTIVFKHDDTQGNARGYYIFVFNSMLYCAFGNSKDLWSKSMVTGGIIFPNKTTRIACTFNDRGDAKEMSLYLNGTLVARSTTKYPIKYSHKPLQIGRGLNDATIPGNLTNGYFQGTISDLRIYNYALSDAEIQALQQSAQQPVVQPQASCPAVEVLHCRRDTTYVPGPKDSNGCDLPGSCTTLQCPQVASPTPCLENQQWVNNPRDANGCYTGGMCVNIPPPNCINPKASGSNWQYTKDPNSNVTGKRSADEQAMLWNNYCNADANAIVYFYCGADSFVKNSSIACRYGCQNGACIATPPTCTDSDNGRDFNTKGTASNSLGETGTDYCSGDHTLVEYYCSEDGNGRVKQMSKSCLLGCQNGVCVSCINNEFRLANSVSGHYYGVEKCVGGSWVAVTV